MRALTVQPGKAGTSRVDELPEPVPGADELLVDGLVLGVCGTDREIVAGDYGWAPPGRDRLVLGHESLGRVRQAPPGGDFVAGDLVVGVVRRPDPQPCGAADVAGRLQPDIVVEATGAGPVIFAAIANTAPYGITCLTGVSTPGRRLTIDAGAENRQIVLENNVVVGSVNANLRHYSAAADALARTDPDWLQRLITRRIPLEKFGDALTAHDDDIKVVLTLTEDGR